MNEWEVILNGKNGGLPPIGKRARTLAVYTWDGKEKVRVTVNAARVSVKPLFHASRFQNVGPERLTEQAVEDFESMIEAARSRLKLAAPPELPISRRKKKGTQNDLP